MNWPLFCSTFLLIFLAELGDKTQLAVMSQSAANSYRWTIFFAAAMALAVSTAIGVLAGDLIRRFIPDERWLKWASGFLFIFFGIMMLRDGWRAKHTSEIETPPDAVVSSPSWIGRGVIQQLGVIERASVYEYEELAKTTNDPEARQVFQRILEEEKWHHSSMLCALAGGAEHDLPFTEALASRLPPVESFVAKIDLSRPDWLEKLIDRKKMIARLYQTLSEKIQIVRLSDTFEALAATEENHAKRLEKLRR